MKKTNRNLFDKIRESFGNLVKRIAEFYNTEWGNHGARVHPADGECLWRRDHPEAGRGVQVNMLKQKERDRDGKWNAAD